MTRPTVLSYPPQPRRRPSLAVKLLERGGSHDPARARAVYAELRRDPYSDAHPITTVEAFGRRARRWVLAHEVPIAAIAGSVLGVLAMLAIWSVMR